MNMVDIILKKKAGGELNEEEIRFFARGAADGSIPDYQLSALLMAICWQGMNAKETTCLTMEMMHSGGVVDLSAIDGVCVDKHSTGGVGDTTTLMLVPLAAACGAKVAKISGRGLGHTGGTLDKLESIPGCSVEETEERFVKQVQEIGCAVIGQTHDLCPADKALYALRDVTGTVNCIPLIASSIVSKKLASGAGLAKLKEMIAAQGGDAGVCDDVTRLPQAKHLVPVPAPHDGYVADMDTTAIGYCAQDLGAGRKQKTDVIDPAVGLVMNVRIGDFVKQGDALATLHLNKPEQAERAIARMQQAVKLTADKPAIPPLVYASVSPEGVARGM